jgi:hypothetical protein
MMGIKNFFLQLIDNGNSEKNSKIFIALCAAALFFVSCLAILFWPVLLPNAPLVIWAELTLCAGALGINGFENIKK